MTVKSFLELTDALTPDEVDPLLSLRWLEEIEGRVRVELSVRVCPFSSYET